MNLPSLWVDALASPRSRKVVIATLALSAPTVDALTDRHPAEQNSMIRSATHPGVVIFGRDGVTAHPFWPSLLTWPLVKRSWRPTDRGAAITTVQLSVSSNAGIMDAVSTMAGRVAGWGRVDLWTDGASLDEVLPLAAGKLRLIANDRREGAWSFEIEDGEPTGRAHVGSLIDNLEFPDAPATVAGIANRQLVVGTYPDHLTIHQIDATGRLFYVHDYAAAVAPTRIEIGSVQVTTPFQSVVGIMASTGTPFQALLFERNPYGETAAVGQLSCSFGIGIDSESPAITLLRLAGYDLTSAAKTLLSRSDVLQNVFVGSEADILSLVRDRILPQTDAVLTWRMGKVDVLRTRAPRGSMSLGVGMGLRSRWPLQQRLTELAQVYNSFTVAWGRDASRAGSTPSGARVTVDQRYGGRIGSLLAASVSRYGSRPFPQLILAPDLGTQREAELLGEDMAELLAFQHDFHRYSADWLDGMQVDLNTRVLLSDSTQGLDDKACVVTDWELGPTGPMLIMQTEDRGQDAMVS